MKFNTTMPERLKLYFREELISYNSCRQNRNWQSAWSHLERAHIIGQRYPFEHTYVHWLMLKFGFQIKDIREIIGQLPRLLFGGVKSFVGRVPVGNPGGANVNMLQPFPISEDLKGILDKE